MSHELTISKTSEFFVAICKFHDHSFVVIGVQDPQTKQNHILCSLGQYCNIDPAAPRRSKLSIYLSMLFSNEDACLVTEFGPEKNNFEVSEFAVTYKAYSIQKENYFRFLALLYTLKYSHPEVEYGAYQLIEEDEENMTFVYDKVEGAAHVVSADDEKKIEAIYEKGLHLSMGNTCRHTGLSLFQWAIGGDFSDSKLSHHFFDDLPFSAKIVKVNQFNERLLVFPLPLEKKPADMQDDIYKFLCEIYSRLKKISVTYRENKDTYEKFNKLKTLYMQIYDKRTIDAVEVFRVTKEWDKENAALVDTKRGSSLFSSTATRNMLSHFYSDVSQVSRKAVGAAMS